MKTQVSKGNINMKYMHFVYYCGLIESKLHYILHYEILLIQMIRSHLMLLHTHAFIGLTQNQKKCLIPALLHKTMTEVKIIL